MVVYPQCRTLTFGQVVLPYQDKVLEVARQHPHHPQVVADAQCKMEPAVQSHQLFHPW
jgi:hypothetical protein